MSEIRALSAAALGRALAARELSAVEAAEHYLCHIEKTNSDLAAYLLVSREAALVAARRVDERRAAGEALSPLAGVPMALKDNLCTEGVRTTCASRMLENFVPGYPATVAEKLDAAGCPLLGKLNMDEFAMGSSGENSAFAKAKNPRDKERVPGGSSGGAAAAVASRSAPFALGSDTGGSIRQPAAFCGAVGLKPTYGSVSRYGLVAFASSLDQIGPLARNVEDAALVMNAIAGHDERDSTSVQAPVADYAADLAKGVSGLRVALVREFLGEGIAPDVKRDVQGAAKQLENLGARVEEVSMPALPAALPAYYVISSAEASSNLARFDGVRYGHRAAAFDSVDALYENSRSEGFGSEVKRRIMLGTFALSAGYYDAYYKKAQQVRTLVIRECARVLGDYDLILSPTAPTTAYRFGEKSEPMQMYLGDICTVPANIAGLPALSLPCGRDENGLPVGVQMMGTAFSEPLLLRAAAALEAALGGDF